MIIQCYIRELNSPTPLPAEWDGPFPPPYGALLVCLNGTLRMSTGRPRGATGVITVNPPPDAVVLGPSGIAGGEEFGEIGGS